MNLNQKQSLETEAYLDGTVKTNNSAIEVEADIEQTGDYTQTGDYNLTGDQDVTGSVTISEKETINNLAPEASGTYVDYDYWKLDNTDLITNTGVPVTSPVGTEKSSTLLSTPDLLYFNEHLFLVHEAESAGWEWSTNGSYYYYDMSNPRVRHDGKHWSNYKEQCIPRGTTTYTKVVVTDSGETLLNNNDIYFYEEGRWLSWNEGDVIYDTSILAELNSRNSHSGTRTSFNYFNWNKVTLTTTGYTDEYLGPIGSISYVHATHKAYYTPYEEYVQGIDENHQYTVADEVLTTNGSEKVTRDLKVQGWIYQDEYKRAILPNINANTINSNGGTLVIGELL